MGIVEINTDFSGHPDVLDAGLLASQVFLASALYSSQYATDGFLPRSALGIVSMQALSGPEGIAPNFPSRDEVARALVRAGLWQEEAEEGWRLCHRDVLWRFASDPADQDARNGAPYRRWRRAVLERDGFCCQECGATPMDAELYAHHLRPFAAFPDGRLDPSNGITLCKECHRKAHRRRER